MEIKLDNGNTLTIKKTTTKIKLSEWFEKEGRLVCAYFEKDGSIIPGTMHPHFASPEDFTEQALEAADRNSGVKFLIFP